MPTSVLPPVFHPDHPHNRYPGSVNTPLGSSFDNNIPMPPVHRSRYPACPPSAYKSPGGMSDSDASASGSPSNRRCFCGREVVDGGIYCSIECARSDAFTSLCYKPSGSSSSTSASLPTLSLMTSRQPTYDTSLSAPISRTASSSGASISDASESSNVPEWNASHYRRMARADSRREERRDERRRRRAEGSVASSTVSRTTSTVSSSSTSRVPDLIGGYSGLHSRNLSTASTASTSTSTSGWSGSTLSRNPSSASNVSSTSRRYRGDRVGVIQEDEDEEETLDTRPYPIPVRNGASIMGMGMGSMGHKKSRSGQNKTKIVQPMGMGKDMRDILEEIISMEKSFNIDDGDEPSDNIQPIQSTTPTPPGLFTAVFDRPPRTPSPSGHGRKKSIAPNAPIRGHRSSLSLSNHPSGLAPPPAPQHAPSRVRPISGMMGLHQSSLSESHTALYLATASPVAASRRSASPKLRSRNSLTFTPEAAGPAINGLGPSGSRFDSPTINGISTPSKRRPQISPSASYGTMDGWRFPGSGNGTFGGTTTPQPPKRPLVINTNVPAPSLPRAPQVQGIPPHLLWPSQPLFPQSPGIDTPQFLSALHRPIPQSNSGMSLPHMPLHSGPSDFHAPESGMRLGVLLGSGEDGEEEDVEMGMEDDEEDDVSTAHGHGNAGQYLPVFLEAEGFRGHQGRPW